MEEPQYTLTIVRAWGATIIVKVVMGVEIDGTLIRYWFESTGIKTQDRLDVGDSIHLERVG